MFKSRNLLRFIKIVSVITTSFFVGIAQEINQPDFILDFKYSSSWDDGFVGIIYAKNTGNEDIVDWQISFKGRFGISEEWNAFQINKESLNGGYRYTFNCADWNRVIEPGETVSFGFSAEYSGALPAPQNIKLNNLTGERGVVQTFYADWSNYIGVRPTDLPLTNLNKIVHAFAVINDNGEVTHGDRYSDIEMLLEGDSITQPLKGAFNQYQKIKELYPNIDILISIIARNHNRIDYKNAAATAERRRKFTLSAIDFMRRFNFDGISIDWEFPEADDKDNLSELIKTLRDELDRVGFGDNKHYELSFSSPVAFYLLKDIDFPAITPHLDEVSIMGFNYFGPWEGYAGHNSPLYHNVTDELPFPPEIKEYLKVCNIDWTVNYHLENGVPAGKISLGLPIYSHSWTNVIDIYGNGGLFSEGIGADPIFYNQALSLYHDSGYTRYWDDLSKTAYLYNPNVNGGHFVTFDDTASIRYKCEYINDKHFRGVSFWMGALDGQGEESLIVKSSEVLDRQNDKKICKKK